MVEIGKIISEGLSWLYRNKRIRENMKLSIVDILCVWPLPLVINLIPKSEHYRVLLDCYREGVHPITTYSKGNLGCFIFTSLSTTYAYDGCV